MGQDEVAFAHVQLPYHTLSTKCECDSFIEITIVTFSEQSSSPSTTHKSPTPQLETSTPVLTTSTSHDTAYAPSQASESAGSENIVGPIM